MSLKTGDSLGPYKILGSIGAGGMGEVYRARDERLSRDVAVKVLPPTVAGDADRLRRFELEARATGQLNHPNILAIYDIGEHDGAPYVVEELLEGETLRRRLETSGAMPVRKAVELARQIARGLAAAHEKGIVHRDLKPENLFITGDGRVKILDFGLAKLTQPDTTETSLTEAPTRVETGAGVILGSVGYMAPEQVRGQAVDARSDIFSLGAILHEMLTGKRAFAADSAVETMNAILRSEPPEVSRLSQESPGMLDAVVRRCLEKSPGERFQSASDLAFQLQAIFSSDSMSGARPAAMYRPRRRLPGPLLLAAAGVLAAAAVVLAYAAGQAGRPAHTAPEYRQLTFRQGTIFSARFNPDGATAVYAAAWEGRPRELLTTPIAVPGPRTLGLEGAEILSVAPTGELAVLLDPEFTAGWMRTGTLARLPSSGGVPREILEGVQDATWGPDGESLAVIREAEGRYRLEYPVGTVLAETRGWYSSPRFSRDGRRIAVIHHPAPSDSRGQVALADLGGDMRMLTEPFSSADGLAWSADGDEIWFSAGRTGNVAAIYGVDLAGRLRMVDGAPTDLTLMDISPEGTVLLSRNLAWRGIVARAPDEGTERDLSYMDWSRPAGISRDGRWVLFDEQGQGGGPEYTLYLRGTDGSPPVQLGKGGASALSADGRWAMSYSVAEPKRLSLVPVGAGERRLIEVPGMTFSYGAWFPDSERLLVEGAEKGQSGRLWELTLDSNQVRPLSPEGAGFPYFISGDGRLVLARGVDGLPWLFPTDGSEPRPVPGGRPGDVPVGLGDDGRFAYVGVRGRLPRPVQRIDVASGERTPWLALMPANDSGLLNVDYIHLTPDGKGYVYSYRRVLSTLYVVEGLR